MFQPPTKLDDLDDLLAWAAHYAGYCLRSSGMMPPTLFLIGAEGPVMFMPASLADGREKDNFATTARLLCIAHGATVVVMALEAWMKTAKPNKQLDLTEPPSEAFDREEAVVLMGESQTGQQQKFLPIIRNGNGRFFGFGEYPGPAAHTMAGRFAQLLPPKAPTDEHRAIARAILQTNGVPRGACWAIAPPGGGRLLENPGFAGFFHCHIIGFPD